MLVFMGMTVTSAWFVVVTMSHNVEETSDDGNTEGTCWRFVAAKKQGVKQTDIKVPAWHNERKFVVLHQVKPKKKRLTEMRWSVNS